MAFLAQYIYELGKATHRQRDSRWSRLSWIDPHQMYRCYYYFAYTPTVNLE